MKRLSDLQFANGYQGEVQTLSEALEWQTYLEIMAFLLIYLGMIGLLYVLLSHTQFHIAGIVLD